MFTLNLTKTLSKKIKLQPRICKIKVLPVKLVVGDRSNLQHEADPLRMITLHNFSMPP